MYRRSMRVYDMRNALDGIRQTVTGNSGAKFTDLMPHIYEVQRLREAYFALRRDAAPGVDGQSWQLYEQNLEASLLDLSDRLARGGYRSQRRSRV
jgi:RNA-directed DNA polymerase